MDFARFRDELDRLRPAGWGDRSQPRPGIGLDNLVVLERVGSTNRLGRRILDEYVKECERMPPVLLLAWEQTEGKGRLGRTWSSPAGRGVYATLAVDLREPEKLQTLPLLVGVALGRALSRHLPVPCKLKWPNDLLVERKKIGGILIETLVHPGECAAAVIGFGVNLDQAAGELPDGGATSLRLEGAQGLSLARLTWDLVTAVERELEHLGDAAYAAESYRALTLHRPGDPLTCRVGDQVLEGSFAGIDDNGMLLLDRGGEIVRLTAGEVIEG